MASVLLFVFFLLSHLLLLQSGLGEMNYIQKCPLFSCGNLSSIGFPFTTNSRRPECGLFNLECDDSEVGIHLGHDERSYPIFNISPSNTLHIRDKELERHLTTHPCEPLTTFPRTSFFSFEIVSNQTLFFKCYHNLSVHPPPDFKNVSCGDSLIYFSNSSKEGFPGAFPGCLNIPLPQNLDPNGLRNGSDPSSYVAAEFDLQVHVSPECYACFDKGGQCKEDKGEFYCYGVKKEKFPFNKKCPPSSCGNLTFIGFPFASKRKPECGVFTVDCGEMNQTIQLERQGRSYPLLGIYEYNILKIFDEELSERLKSSSCESFTNFTLPSSSFFSFEIVPNQTFFKCNRSLNVPHPPHFKTKLCRDSVIYYNPSNENFPAAFSGCSIIQLPKNLSQDSHRPAKVDDPFSLVTPYIDLEVNVSYECYECYEEGGQCKARANGKFYCKKGMEVGITNIRSCIHS